MSPKPENDIRDALNRSRDELLAAAGVHESVAALKPAEGRWSVIDCIEHVTLVETVFLSRLQPASGEALPADQGREADVMARAIDRSTPRQGPEAVQPKGRYATLAEAVEDFKAVRARTTQFAEDRGGDLLTLPATHPVLGVMNGREALILVAGHSRRHAAQMREAAAAVAGR
jgi:uncharacterized damage-inducible protein DinB